MAAAATTSTPSKPKQSKKKRTPKERAKLIAKFAAPPAALLGILIWPGPVVFMLNAILRLCEAAMLLLLVTFSGLATSTTARRIRDHLAGVSAPAPHVDLALTVRPRRRLRLPSRPVLSGAFLRRLSLRPRNRGRTSRIRIA